jgi:hypothetical protein
MRLKNSLRNRALARKPQNFAFSKYKYPLCKPFASKRHAKTAYLNAACVSRSKFCCLNFLAQKPASDVDVSQVFKWRRDAGLRSRPPQPEPVTFFPFAD